MHEEIKAEVMRTENVTGCEIEAGDSKVTVIVESHLSNDDGSHVERGRAILEMTPQLFHEKGWMAQMMQPFERAILDKHQGYTRYATRAEIGAIKSKVAPAC